MILSLAKRMCSCMHYAASAAHTRVVLGIDTRSAQDLFYAGGQGVPDKQLAAAVEPVQDVVKAMGMATGALTDCMDRILGHHMSMSRRPLPRSCSDYDVLLCILSHRADRVASKYLKERRKMPKMDGKRKGIFF